MLLPVSESASLSQAALFGLCCIIPDVSPLLSLALIRLLKRVRERVLDQGFRVPETIYLKVLLSRQWALWEGVELRQWVLSYEDEWAQRVIHSQTCMMRQRWVTERWCIGSVITGVPSKTPLFPYLLILIKDLICCRVQLFTLARNLFWVVRLAGECVLMHCGFFS